MTRQRVTLRLEGTYRIGMRFAVRGLNNFASADPGGLAMTDTWFTADFHLGHQNIIRYCDRPFQTLAVMDAEIVDRLNSSVKESDTLYFLGDFCGGTGKIALDYRKRIRCKNIFFIEGNHDDGAHKIASEFRWFKQLAEVKVEGQFIVLCHYAMRVWHHSFRGAWHLYGHSHGRLPDDPLALSMDVGVDTHDFRPWHFDEIRVRMGEKSKLRVAHGNLSLPMDSADEIGPTIAPSFDENTRVSSTASSIDYA